MIEIIFKNKLIETYLKNFTKNKDVEIILRNAGDVPIYKRINLKKHGKISEEDVKQLLLSLKFNLSSKRIKYLIDAIMLILDNKDLMENLNNLYSIIGIKYKKNKESIKWSIIGIIDVMNKHITKDQLRSFFYIYDNEKVSTKHFFTMVYQYFNSKE